MTTDRFMRRAAELAIEKMEANTGGPFGAVIVRDGKIVAEGWNEVTSANDPTAHAEVSAIRRACRTLGTFRLDECEIVTSCEPCPMCLGAIYWARLRRITYASTRQEAATIGFDDDFLYREIALAPEARSIPARRVALPDGLDPFAAWNAKSDKIRY